MTRHRRLAAAMLGGTALVTQAAPAVSVSTALRLKAWPALAGVGRRGHVALTLDDGPDRRSTPAFLDLLHDHGVRATFFLLGRMLQTNPEVGRQIAAAGHEIAVHGWDHRPAPLYGPAAAYDGLARTCDLIGEVTGSRPGWYRPPYGVLSASVLWAAGRLDLTPVLWTAWGRDWRARATPESVTATVTRRLDDGGTILLHDSDCTSAAGSWRATLAALPDIIGHVRSQGLTIGSLDEHFRQPSIYLRPQAQPGLRKRSAAAELREALQWR